MVIRFVFEPRVSEEAFVAQNAIVIGNVIVEEDASIWYSAVLRGDVNWIYVGKGTNIQDGVIVHAETSLFPTFIGNYVTIGHKAVVHGCTIKDFSLIGISSVILNGAEIGPYSIVGAGSVVLEKTKIPPGVLAVGVPAKIKRELKDEEIEMLKNSSKHYIELAKKYKKLWS